MKRNTELGWKRKERSKFDLNTKGRLRKKTRKKCGLLPNSPWTPPPPPPVWHFFKKKNLPPFFLLKIASLMAETNFTLGPTSKTNKFPLLFMVIVVQNSQHKRANLNGSNYSVTLSKQFLKLDIYSNNFRPSVKHVLGVLE